MQQTIKYVCKIFGWNRVLYNVVYKPVYTATGSQHYICTIHCIVLVYGIQCCTHTLAVWMHAVYMILNQRVLVRQFIRIIPYYRPTV